MNTAIILAAGKGTRMNAGINKQFILINGKPLLTYTLEAFQRCTAIDSIILVTSREELQLFREKIIDVYGFDKVDKLVCGGSERQQSVLNGIRALDKDCSVVVIHDGARPVVTDGIIERCIEGAKSYGAVSTGMPVKDTIKILDKESFIEHTPDRRRIWITQTPQAFKRDVIINAYERALATGVSGTDDAFLVENTGIKVKMIEGSYENIKITTPEDLIIAEALIKKT